MLIIGLAIWLVLPPKLDHTYTSSPDVRESIELPDGSAAVLDPGSRMHSRLTREARQIHLDRGGGALFIVAHEPGRPFDVHLGSVIASGRGTTFTARHDSSGHVYLEVEEGRVALIQKGRELAVLIPGEEATVTPERAYIKPSSERQFDFDGKTLSQAVEQFNLYNRQQLRIVDPELSTLRLSGHISATAIEPFAIALAPRGIRLERNADELRLLR